MTHVMTYDLSDRWIEGAAGWLASLRETIEDRRLFRRTYQELAALSDRELADLGVARHSIREIARESVYGA